MTVTPWLSADDYRWSNWSLRQTSPWHLAPCRGDDRDKTTLCGRTMLRHAQWSRPYLDPGATACSACCDQARKETPGAFERLLTARGRA